MDDPDLQRLVEVQDAFEKDVTEPFCKLTSVPLLKDEGAKKIMFQRDIGSLRLKNWGHTIEYNFNKEAFTYSTNLINHYMTLDPRVQTFLFAIKLFGRGRSLFASKLAKTKRIKSLVLTRIYIYSASKLWYTILRIHNSRIGLFISTGSTGDSQLAAY